MKTDLLHIPYDKTCNVYKSGIYVLLNIVSGKLYIGQARRPFITRWLEHQWSFETNTCKNNHLLNSIKKYGLDNFIFSVQEYLPDEIEHFNTKEATNEEITIVTNWLNYRETFWIRYYRLSFGDEMIYNMNDGGTGANPTNEMRKIFSKSQQKKWESETYKEMMKESFRNADRSYITQEFRNDISNRNRELWKTESYRNKMILVLRNRTISDTGKKNMSIAQCIYFSSSDSRRKKREEQLKWWDEHPEARIEYSKRMKETYESEPERKEQLKKLIEEKYTDPVYKAKHSQSQRRRWESDKEHIRYSELNKKRFESQNERDRISQSIKKLYVNPEYTAKRKAYYEKVKEKTKYRDLGIDNILYYLYEIWPAARNWRTKQKLEIIEEISNELKKMNYDNESR